MSRGPRNTFRLSHLPVLLWCVGLLPLSMPPLHAQDRATKVRNDRDNVEKEGRWIYNHLPRAFEEAKRTGKPILVVLRCIPCEACAKLDEAVINEDAKLQKLMDQFVRVRVVQTNGLDLSLFQYDYDQSFAVMLLHADGTIYGRFGTRSHQEETHNDISLKSFAKALEGALELHRAYPGNKESLAAKRGPAPAFPVPEKTPNLRGKYTDKLDYEGNVVKSCIHCHQVGEALRAVERNGNGGKLSVKTLFPYPMPNLLGLVMDPEERAMVKMVKKGSPAEKAGFQRGDVILTLQGQPLLSIADIQWVLHHSPNEGTLHATVRRGKNEREFDLELTSGWRQRGDISWRVSTWELRGQLLGGLVMESTSLEERVLADLKPRERALRVKHLGQYGIHATAKNVGFKKGDMVVEVDQRPVPASETELIAYALNERKRGEELVLTVVRDGERRKFKLPLR